MKNHIQTLAVPWIPGQVMTTSHQARKSKHTKQKGLKKVHTTMVDQAQNKVDSGANGRKCRIVGDLPSSRKPFINILKAKS